MGARDPFHPDRLPGEGWTKEPCLPGKAEGTRTRPGGCGRRKAREQAASACCGPQVTRPGLHSEPRAEGRPLEGFRVGSALSARRPQGPCGWPSRDLQLQRASQARNTLPRLCQKCPWAAPFLLVSWESECFLAHIWKGTQMVQGGTQDILADLDPTEGCPKSTTRPEPKTWRSGFACSRSSTAPAEAEKARPRGPRSGLARH